MDKDHLIELILIVFFTRVKILNLIRILVTLKNT